MLSSFDMDRTTGRIHPSLLVATTERPGSATYFGRAMDLLKYVPRVAKVAEFDGDEVGYVVGKVA